MELSLDGKVAVVTGASRGIGAAVADALAAERARLVLIARDAVLLDSVASKIRDRHGADCLAVATDLLIPDAADIAVSRALERFGTIDVLVNNAGASGFGSFDAVSDGDWQHAFELKLLGYVRMVRAVLPAMREQRVGRIVNVIGMAGRVASPGYVLGAFNAALMHLTRALSSDLAPDGIVVKGINPGPTNTERMAAAFEVWARDAGVEPDAYIKDYMRGFALREIASPEEMAKLVVLLASPVSDRLIGTVLQADGGATTSVA
jgi:3-oxoacyl-[acyl-carrier protein] reductase